MPRGGFEYETKRMALREHERIQVVVGSRSFVLISGPSMERKLDPAPGAISHAL
jgi:hypothetical protein